MKMKRRGFFGKMESSFRIFDLSIVQNYVYFEIKPYLIHTRYLRITGLDNHIMIIYNIVTYKFVKICI